MIKKVSNKGHKMSYSLEERVSCDQGGVRNARLTPDGNFVLTSGANKTVKLWSFKVKKLLKTFSGHGHEVLECVGSCDNAHVLSGGADKAVFLWDVSNGHVVRHFRAAHAGTVNTVKFNEDSSLAISGGSDATVKVSQQ